MLLFSVAALTSPIDIYCERLGPQLWAEPVNALTNLSFIAAAFWGASSAHARAERSLAVWLLIALAAAIGIGSFLFHTVAQVWASFADTVPIWLFVALACAICTVRLGGVRPGRVAVGALLLATAIAVRVGSSEGRGHGGPPPLNGSLQYAPAVLALAVFTLVAFWRHHALRWWVAAALGVFIPSLTARTFDQAVCGTFPLGLHWIWHLLNGLLIGIVLQIVLRSAPHRAVSATTPR